jgi:hypothetical protein
MPLQSHLPRLDHANYTWQSVQIIKLIDMQLSPSSNNSIRLRSKCSPQRPVLKHPQSVLMTSRINPSIASFTSTPDHFRSENYCKFDARGTVVPNTATTSAHVVEIKMATFTDAECARCVFGWKKRSLYTSSKEISHCVARNLPVSLQFTRGTRMLFAPFSCYFMPHR